MLKVLNVLTKYWRVTKTRAVSNAGTYLLNCTPNSLIAKASATNQQFGHRPARKLYSGLPFILIVLGLYLFWLPIHATLAQVTIITESKNSTNDSLALIGSYIENKTKLILQNGPAVGRRLYRVRGTNSKRDTNQNINEGLNSTFHFDEMRLSPTATTISNTSLKESSDEVAEQPKERTDLWTETSIARFNSQNGQGAFKIAHIGADYLIEPNFIFGIGAQFDWANYDSQSVNFVTYNTIKDIKFISDIFNVQKIVTYPKLGTIVKEEITKSNVDGFGYMLGPYLTKQITNNIFFDGRINWGRSFNTVSPYGTFRDNYTTNRLLVKGALIGEYKYEEITIRPTVNLSYFRDQSDSFTNKNGSRISNLEIETGTVDFGPTFSKVINLQNDSIVTPFFSITGIWTFKQENSVSKYLDNYSTMAAVGLRTKLQAGAQILNDNGVGFNFYGSYDGIGDPNYEAWALNIGLARKW